VENNEQFSIICKSVFKSDIDTDLKKRYTRKWIELINNSEKNKSLSQNYSCVDCASDFRQRSAI